MKKAAITAALMGVLLHLPSLCFAQEGPTPDSGITAWMITSTALVLLMVPGLALFYGGLVRTKNVLGTMMHSYAAMAIVGVLWAVCGYSMSFGPSVLGGWVGWDPNLLFLEGLDNAVTDGGIPEYVFAMFQGKFAIITPALIAGAFAERVKFKSYCLFIVLWVLFVYCPLCHWVWAEDGFLFNMGANGAIDFAGGTVVHISSGISALVIALYIGARRGYPRTAMHPNNLVLTLLGAGLLWVGWFGFNAGSSVNSGLDTARALTVTQVAGAAGALMWMIVEGLRHGKVTSLGLASGILAGLVVITPAAGVVKVPGAIILGFTASIISYFAIQLKSKLGYDDTLDVFGIHGVSGIVGALGLTFFIREEWMLEAAAAAGGTWGVGQQLGVQLAATGITIAYAVVTTLLITFLVDKLWGFRVSERSEMTGLDEACHGEHGYGLLNLN
ncbi:MAG: ammonium transporter [Candidatus Omnitrophica bacterium]|nr:ammonium transporter [Candidatus Omnitrophota bacterium]